VDFSLLSLNSSVDITELYFFTEGCGFLLSLPPAKFFRYCTLFFNWSRSADYFSCAHLCSDLRWLFSVKPLDNWLFFQNVSVDFIGIYFSSKLIRSLSFSSISLLVLEMIITTLLCFSARCFCNNEYWTNSPCQLSLCICWDWSALNVNTIISRRELIHLQLL
jgi:hypothetical protein